MSKPTIEPLTLAALRYAFRLWEKGYTIPQLASALNVNPEELRQALERIEDEAEDERRKIESTFAP